MKEQIKRLKKAILIMTDEGIYPKAIKGNDGYKKRSGFQNGWNACNIAITEKLSDILEEEDWPEDVSDTETQITKKKNKIFLVFCDPDVLVDMFWDEGIAKDYKQECYEASGGYYYIEEREIK